MSFDVEGPSLSFLCDDDVDDDDEDEGGTDGNEDLLSRALPVVI